MFRCLHYTSILWQHVDQLTRDPGPRETLRSTISIKLGLPICKGANAPGTHAILTFISFAYKCFTITTSLCNACFHLPNHSPLTRCFASTLSTIAPLLYVLWCSFVLLCGGINIRVRYFNFYILMVGDGMHYFPFSSFFWRQWHLGTPFS
jgi:hypothetical protein